MSYIDLADVKAFLNVIHSHDDAKIQALLDGAEAAALDFLNRTHFGELCEEDSNYDGTVSLPDNVRIGVYFLVSQYYDGRPEDQEIIQKTAERLLIPYRCEMGI